MKKIKNILIIIIIGIVICSIILTINNIIKTNKDIDKSFSEEYITDENTKKAISEGREKIRKNEIKKIVLGESLIVILGIVGIVVIEKKVK